MIIYEVSLTVANEILVAYEAWIKTHIQEMLQFKGFINATLAKDLEAKDKATLLSVRYVLQDEKSLQDYLNEHAHIMREQAIKKFSNQFSAVRKIYHLIESFA